MCFNFYEVAEKVDLIADDMLIHNVETACSNNIYYKVGNLSLSVGYRVRKNYVPNCFAFFGYRRFVASFSLANNVKNKIRFLF